MTTAAMEPVRADDEYIEQLRDGGYPDDRLGLLLAAWRDEVQGTPRWRPLIPEAHLAHVRAALAILTLLVTGLSVVVPTRTATVVCWLAAVVAWIGFIIAIVIPAFDRDEVRRPWRR